MSISPLSIQICSFQHFLNGILSVGFVPQGYYLGQLCHNPHFFCLPLSSSHPFVTQKENKMVMHEPLSYVLLIFILKSKANMPFLKSYFLFTNNIIPLLIKMNFQQDFKYSHVVYMNHINFSVNSKYSPTPFLQQVDRGCIQFFLPNHCCNYI